MNIQPAGANARDRFEAADANAMTLRIGELGVAQVLNISSDLSPAGVLRRPVAVPGNRSFAFAAKRAFARARPQQTDDPNRWFQGGGHESFPSGEVSLQAAFVTPFIAEYASDAPWVWALELLPAYDAVARVKTHGHWQSDVLVGWAVGTAFGMYAHGRNTPLTLGWSRDGAFVGFRKRF